MNWRDHMVSDPDVVVGKPVGTPLFPVRILARVERQAEGRTGVGRTERAVHTKK